MRGSQRILKKNAKVLCHFTLDGVDECARIDEVLDNLAKAFPKTKFVRIRPELGSKSPTLQIFGASTCRLVSCISKTEDSPRGRTGSISLAEETGFQKRKA